INRSSEDMATEMLAEVRVRNPRMTRIPVAQPHYTPTATYKDEALVSIGHQRHPSTQRQLIMPPLPHFAGNGISILQLFRERRITLCSIISGIIASVVPSTPCKCVCRADQRRFHSLPGLPFVADAPPSDDRAHSSHFRRARRNP
ncbi:hypothetical protein, partial [Rhizobium aethiopicum]|uniref:hypothetical protein n=1 Tax=Rhizobium aethiopicum TaxID=1138170 RepID=UPI001AEEA08B